MQGRPIKTYLFACITATAIAVVLFLRFWNIGAIPRGFAVDECSIAYNAYSIAVTGADEYGASWPVFFRGIDVYYDPADVYSVVLPMRLFGLTQWAARLPCVLYSLALSVAFSLLLRHWRFEPYLALAGGFMLSVIPWIFPLSRNCAYAGHFAALLGLVAGMTLTSAALRRQSNLLAVLAGISWASTFYTHQSVLPVLVVLAIGCAVVLWRSLLLYRQKLLVIAVSALVVILPLIINVLRFPEGLTARFHQVSGLNENSSPKEAIRAVASRYLDYFGPQFLFISGDHEPRHHTGHGGELYWCLAPLILVGLYVAIRHCRQHAFYRVVLVGILACPVSAALTTDRMHSTRSVYGVIFWVLLAMLGIQWLWLRRGSWRAVLLVVASAAAFEIAYYMHDYFGAYRTRDPQAFQTELTVALEYCFAHLETNQVLYISASTFNPYGATVDSKLKPRFYAAVLFFGKIDPRLYQRWGLPTDTVRLYDGHPSSPGLLLRSNNYYFLEPGDLLRVVPDPVPVPSNARPLLDIPFGGVFSFANAQYQVFAIP